MTRGPSRALARTFALALSLALVGSTLVLPAFADTTGGIIAPGEGDTFTVGDTLLLEADSGGSSVVNWAVRLGDPSRNSPGTKAGNVDGEDDPFTLDDSTFTAAVDTAGWEPSEEYFFVFNWGDPNDDDTRDVVRFSILDPVDDPLEDFEPDEVTDCADGEGCSTAATGGTNQAFQASTANAQAKEGQTARLGLRIPGAEDATSGAVFDACQHQLRRFQRLGGEVAQLVPVGFDGGSLTVRNFIPREVIRSDFPRWTRSFQVCIAPTEEEAGLYEDAGYEGLEAIGETGLVGPILLERCRSDEQTACVETRRRLLRGIVITFRIPAADPWMM